MQFKILEKGTCDAKTREPIERFSKGIEEDVKAEVDKLIQIQVTPRKIVKKLKSDGFPLESIPTVKQIANRQGSKMRSECKIVSNGDFSRWTQERIVEEIEDLNKFQPNEAVVVQKLENNNGFVFTSCCILRSYSGELMCNNSISLMMQN